MSLAAFFILGFIFKYYSDFKFLEKWENKKTSKAQIGYLTGNQQPADSAASKNQTQIINDRLNNIINQAVINSPQNISALTQQKSLININEVIHAKEKNDLALNNNTYVLPDQNPNFLPIRDWAQPFIEVSAKSAIIANQDVSKILYQKNIFEKLPIASLTKIMTAIVITENTNIEETTKISKEAIAEDGDGGNLITGGEMTISNLLKALLMESSNDAAFVLEEFVKLKNKDLIKLMNEKAQTLGLKDTRFSSASGLLDKNNFSTAYDMARLVSYSLSNKQIWDILNLETAEISYMNKLPPHHLVNNNQLLEKMSPNLMGGKTGFTEQAGGCFLSVFKINPHTFSQDNRFYENNLKLTEGGGVNGNQKIITIVLGSDDRFGETEKLINWVQKAYRF